MIEELTPEQRAKFPMYVDKWNAIGLATGPADREKAKDAIERAYEKAGFSAPANFVFFEAPIPAAKSAVILKAMWDNSTEKWLSASSFKLDKNKLKEDRDWDDIFDSTMSQMGWTLTTDERDAVISNIDMSKNEVHNALQEQVWGNHDGSWLCFYDFFLQEFDLDCCKALIPLMDLSRVSGWWAPYSNVAIVQDRPFELKLNDNNEIHCEDGPCITYEDGFKIYAINGVRVPEKVVMNPELITLKDIDDEQDQEVRRIMTERYGYDRYFLDSGAETVDMDFVKVTADSDQTMPRMLIRTKEGDMFLVGTDGSTNRVYTMPVLSEGRGLSSIKTCREAHEQICGFSEDDCVAQS